MKQQVLIKTEGKPEIVNAQVIKVKLEDGVLVGFIRRNSKRVRVHQVRINNCNEWVSTWDYPGNIAEELNSKASALFELFGDFMLIGSVGWVTFEITIKESGYFERLIESSKTISVLKKKVQGDQVYYRIKPL